MKRTRQRRGAAPDLVEWMAGGLSAVLVLAMIGFVLYQALSETAAEPELSIVVERVEAAGEGFRVEFRAVNRGGSTAAGVTVQGTLARDGREVESSEVDVDYVPANSARRGALLFSGDPREYQLQVRAKGYTDP